MLCVQIMLACGTLYEDNCSILWEFKTGFMKSLVAEIRFATHNVSIIATHLKYMYLQGYNNNT